MAAYDYQCEKCSVIEEHFHPMIKNPTIKCPKCKNKMKRIISGGNYIISGGLQDTRADHKEKEHTKKVKDPERAVKNRNKHFGKEAVGDPSMKTDPMHIVKRGRSLGGQQKDVDKKEFIQAAAKDPLMVKRAQDVLKKKK